MGYKQSPGLIAIVAALLLLAAVVTPLAYGQLVNVNGRLCCTPNGSCPPGSAGVQGAPVNVNCTSLSGRVETRRVNTNTAGQFNVILLNTTINLETPTIPCIASVSLPLNSTNCDLLDTAFGIIRGVIQLMEPIELLPPYNLSVTVSNLTVNFA